MFDFFSCIESGIFPTEWILTNVVPIYKRDDKPNVKNYRPVLLLPIFVKRFERLIYNKINLFFTENDLISLNQSGLKQGDSCINQLLSLTHDVHQSLEQNGIDGPLENFNRFLKIAESKSCSKWSTFVF